MTMDLTRRNMVSGVLVSIVAAYVVRNSGLLMPIRDRTLLSTSDLEWETIFGTRDCKKYPATLAEVMGHPLPIRSDALYAVRVFNAQSTLIWRGNVEDWTGQRA
jgi:hypothetical protein